MMSTKFSTQGFSKAVQQHDFGDDPQRKFTPATADGVAADNGKTKDVGEVLNQVANPSGKDSGGHKVRRAHNTLDKDDFLKLMLTQMKNQDPMNPMQSHEMAAQLAQFTSLEQLFNVNKNLENLGTKQDPLAKFEALNFLGKSIRADSRQIFHGAGESANELRFNLGGDATSVKIKISDEMGQPIKEIETGGMNKGLGKIVWNGTDSHDHEVKAGKYSFSVEAVNGAGAKITVQTETMGTITGINYAPEGTLLMVGDQKVRLQDVQKIEDSNLKELQNSHESTTNGHAPTPSSVAPSAAAAATGGTASAKPAGQIGDDKIMSGMDEATNAKLNSVLQEYQKAVMKSKPETAEGGPKLGTVTSPLEVASGGKKGAAFGGRY